MSIWFWLEALEIRLLVLHIVEFSLFILLILLADTVFRLPAKVRYSLWLLALAKVLLPPVFALPAPLPEAIPTLFALELPAVQATAAASAPAISGPVLVLAIWGGFSLAMAGLICLRQQNLTWRLRRSRRAAEPALQLEPLSQTKGARVFYTDAADAPLIRGFFRPALYLPSDFSSWPREKQASVVAHELSHFRHGDSWALLLEAFALVLFGFHPLIWVVRRRLAEIRELRCDEEAITRTGISPLAYSRLLYSFLETRWAKSEVMAMKTRYAADKNSLKKRLRHVLALRNDEPQRSSGRHRLLLGLMALALVPFSWDCSSRPTAVQEPEIAPQSRSVPTDSVTAYDTVPRPVGGFGALQEALHYPEIARKAGIQGRVLVNVLVNTDGTVAETRILHSIGQAGVDEAAMRAVRAIKWHPGRRKGKPVKVWVGVPIQFRLPDAAHAAAPVTRGSGASLPPPAGIGSEKDWTKPPQPVGGFGAMMQNLVYPELARKAGIQGRVIVNVQIAEDGKLVATKVLESLGGGGCDEAAVKALRSVQWRPAEKDGTPITAWVAVPVIFKLDKTQKGASRSMTPTPAHELAASASPVGGLAGVQQQLVLTPATRTHLRSRFPGKRITVQRVVVNALVSKTGSLLDMNVPESSGNSALDAACKAAVQSVAWQPAKNGDGHDVTSWVGVPFIIDFQRNTGKA